MVSLVKVGLQRALRHAERVKKLGEEGRLKLMKELLDAGCALVLDTNVLLNVYRYSPEFSEFALECLRAISNHIILPATVHMEYFRHQRTSFAAMERRFTEIGNETEKQIKLAKTKILDSCANLVRFKYPDVDVLITSVSEKLDAVQIALDNYFEDHASLNLIQHSWDGTDLISALEGTSYVQMDVTILLKVILWWK